MLSLHDAVESGDKEAIKKLLADEGVDVNLQDLYGNTPLHYAAFNGDLWTAESLLARNADLNITAKDGTLAIHHAINNCKPAVTWVLMSCGMSKLNQKTLGYAEIQMVKVIENHDFPSHRADLYAAIHIGLHAFPQHADLIDSWRAFISKLPSEDKDMILEHIDYANILYPHQSNIEAIPKANRTLQCIVLKSLGSIPCDKIYKLSATGVLTHILVSSQKDSTWFFGQQFLNDMKSLINEDSSKVLERN